MSRHIPLFKREERPTLHGLDVLDAKVAPDGMNLQKS